MRPGTARPSTDRDRLPETDGPCEVSVVLGAGRLTLRPPACPNGNALSDSASLNSVKLANTGANGRGRSID